MISTTMIEGNTVWGPRADIIPFNSIPKEQHGLYRQALEKQWKEFLKWNAVEILTPMATAEVLKNVDPARILAPRVLYRDKNVTNRSESNLLDVLAKARIIIPGHRDPDLPMGIRTDAPTVSRLST